MKTNSNSVSIILVSLLLLAGIVFVSYQANQVEGSVGYGNDYKSTTSYAGHPQDVRVLKSSGGTLGSVVITGDNTGFISFYNATTANASLRSASLTTSTILIADFPASSPEGTYTFDIDAPTGLLMVTSGLEATGTVTYR